MRHPADMTFLIEYTNPRKPSRVVTGEYFARFSAFYPVLKLKIGAYAPNRYHAAGFKSIRRIS